LTDIGLQRAETAATTIGKYINATTANFVHPNRVADAIKSKSGFITSFAEGCSVGNFTPVPADVLAANPVPPPEKKK
jgi:hypothetical protein